MTDIIKADLDELVFRARNRDYGSYQLRKNYRRFTVIAFIAGALSFVFLMYLPRIVELLKSDEEAVTKKRQVTYAELAAPPDINEKDKPPPPPPEKMPPPPVKAQVKFIPPTVVKDEKAKPEETIVNIDTFKKTNVEAGSKTVEGDPNAISLIGEEEGVGDAPVEIREDKEPTATEFIAVEKEPQPVNMDEFRRKVGYPPLAKEAQIQGKVIMRVLVDKDGNYVKHIILRNPHPILTSEVEKNVKMLKFVPAVQAGKPIKVWVNLPVDFKLK